MTLRIMPYKMASESARDLAYALGALRVNRDSWTYHPRKKHTIINWGSTSLPTWNFTKPGLFLNWPDSVGTACNKLLTYHVLQEAEINVPPFTTERDTAARWSDEGLLLFARTNLNGHSGHGIIEVTPFTEAENIPRAPVYTQYLSKRNEYRIHVVGSEVLDVQAKRRKYSVPDSEVNWHVRSNANGFVYCRGGITASPATKEVAIQSIKALNLDFGAADVIIHDQIPYVLEVNTAPGLSPTTVAIYAASLLTHIESRRQS